MTESRADLESSDFRGQFDGQYLIEDAHGARFGIAVHAKLHEEQTPYQKIAVYDTPFFGRVLTLDDLVMVTERDEFVYHEMTTHVPLLSMESPRSVLVIGGGDCGCVREILAHPVERVVQCELDERVTRVCGEHFDWIARVEADPRVELRFADGVEYLGDQREAFDLVVIDSTDPTGPALGLFTVDFYQKVARALTPGGVMVAQTEAPFYDPRMVRRIFEQIGSVFDQTHPYWGSIPSYPSGSWTWAYASNGRTPSTYFDRERAERIAERTRYYQPSLQQGAFAVPRLLQRVLAGEDPFPGLS